MEILQTVLAGLGLVVTTVLLVLTFRQRGQTGEALRRLEDRLDTLEEAAGRQRSEEAAERSRMKMELADSVGRSTERMAKVLTDNLRLMQEVTAEQLSRLDRRFEGFALENEQKLEQVRQTTERRLAAMQQQNAEKLDEMRATVDEKLQKTLEERMTQSFQLVNERLEQVYKGLGEMQTLAAGVGDLKKVLSNVKTRGILGEVQLGAILKEILAPEQYAENIATKRDSRDRVEFAVKLPNADGSFTWLPIDAKFHGDAYAQLRDAYERSMTVGSSSQSKMTQKDYELYGTYQPFSAAICHILNHKSGMSHTTWAHTGAPVNIYAQGVGSEKFTGAFDNTEIFHKLAELTNVQ